MQKLIMARRRRKRSDFKSIITFDELNDDLNLGKTINYYFGHDCMKLLSEFSNPVGYSFTKGSKDDTYKHDRNTDF